MSSYLYPGSQTAHVLLSDSGHGGQIRDTDGDEADGYDEGARRGLQGVSTINSSLQLSSPLIMKREV